MGGVGGVWKNTICLSRIEYMSNHKEKKNFAGERDFKNVKKQIGLIEKKKDIFSIPK